MYKRQIFHSLYAASIRRQYIFKSAVSVNRGRRAQWRYPLREIRRPSMLDVEHKSNRHRNYQTRSAHHFNILIDYDIYTRRHANSAHSIHDSPPRFLPDPDALPAVIYHPEHIRSTRYPSRHCEQVPRFPRLHLGRWRCQRSLNYAGAVSGYRRTSGGGR